MTDKQKAAILIVFGGIACLLVASMLFSMFRKSPNTENDNSVTLEIPDAVVDSLDNNKREGYRRNDIRNVDRYWEESVPETDEIDDILSDNSSSVSDTRHNNSHKSDQQVKELTEEDIFGAPARSESRQPAAFTNNNGSSQRTAAKRETKEERLARHQQEKEEAINKAMGINTADTTENPAPDEPKTISIGKEVSVRRTGVISSLESTNTSEISSLDEYDEMIATEEEYPFQCMFVRQAKLKSGSRVAVRLLEDMLVDGVLVQKNTHLMAQCSVGDRVRLSITSIEINGRIYQLNYEAYDNDGGLGIYCPDLKGNETKQAKTSGLNIFNSLIGGRVGNVAREITNTGVAIANSASGEISVIVPAGYTFFIVKKQNQ